MIQFTKILTWVLISVSLAGYAQCPENIGFENGTLSGWQTYVGEVNQQGIISVFETAQPDLSRHVIIKANENDLDPYGGFPKVSPNGSKYSVRLGNENTYHQAERLSYTFTVPGANQYSLILNYAVVLQNFNHTAIEQPRFTVKLYNLTDNNLVECPAFNFVASGNLPGFKQSDIIPASPRNAPVVYKDWSATTIDLTAYAGKQIRLELTTADCIRENHFGYAYFDINESCGETITGNVYCNGQDVVNLQGPRGFAVYKWYKEGDMDEVLGTEQSLKITPAPADGTKYLLHVKPYQDIGCEATLTTTIRKSQDPFTFKVVPEVFFCSGESVNLKAPEITAGSSGDITLEYLKDDVTQDYLRDPDKITQPGIYYIKATGPQGCLNILPIELKLYDAVEFSVTDPGVINYPETIDLSKTFTLNQGYQYFYFSDAKLTTPVVDFRAVSSSGKYYIKAVSSSGCQKVLPVNVQIDPPEPYVISGPKIFTPNNDGVNDQFGIVIKGFVDFGVLSIYSRSGQFLFKTNKQNNLWDGQWNGKPLPAATYYWIFEGTDQYYHTKVTKSGYVSIIK